MQDSPLTDEPPLTLFLAGDVMTGRGIDQVLPHSVSPILFEPYIKNAKDYVRLAERHSGPFDREISYDYVWGDALEALKYTKPDARIINLETAVTTHDEPWPNKSIHYRMHPKNSALLTEAGIDVCVLGNNHIMDWSANGLRETLRVLNNHGLITAGAEVNSNSAKTPAEIITGSGRLLVFSYATSGAGTPKDWQAKKDKPGVHFLESLGPRGVRHVVNEVKSSCRKGNRIVISLHWGGNWGYEVPRFQQKFARCLIDNGVADVIYGHSSHHPKGIEVYKNRLILYGCGDLINDYEGIGGHEQYRGDLSLMYFPVLASSGALISLKMVPMKIHRFQLTKPSQDDVDWMIERLNRVNENYGTRLEKTAEREFLLRWNNKSG